MTTLLAPPAVERLGWVLMHSLWQFLAIALLVRLVERAFADRKAANARYAAGVCGLAAMTAAPFATWSMLPVRTGTSSPATAVVAGAPGGPPLVAPAGPPYGAVPETANPPSQVADPHPAEFSLADTWSSVRARLTIRLRPWLPTLVIGWLVGMSLCSLRPLVGWLALRRLRTVGVSIAGREVAVAVQRIAALLRLTRAVSVWQSTVVQTPLVVGYLRPVVLMPVALLTELPLAELEAILAHELAHVRRHDFVINLWQTVLETAFYYHPAVWNLSRRLRAEREHCCDDLALSVVGNAVCYGRALLHVEELRGTQPLLAFGAGGGSLSGRISRLFGQPSQPSRASGMLMGVLLPSAALATLLAAFAANAVTGDEENKSAVTSEQANNERATKPEPAPVTKHSPAERSLHIVIAEHVILWDGRIRTWDEVVAELREIRKSKGEPIEPHFHFTNGAISAGLEDLYQAKAFEVYRELFEPAGMSLGSMSPKAAPRYDAIRKPEDLIPDPATLRKGIVIENGRPKAGMLVVLVPENGVWSVVLKTDLTLRDPLDDIWTTTDENGRFTLPIPPANAADGLDEPLRYSLAAISPTGYRLAKIPAEGEATKIINLQPLARIELVPVEGKPQRIDLRFDGQLPDKSPGLLIYEIELRDKPITVSLPPGKITVQRAFRHENGRSQGYPAETVRLRTGESRKIILPSITESEAEQRWREASRRPKADPGDE